MGDTALTEDVRDAVRSLFDDAREKVETALLGGALTLLEVRSRVRVMLGEEAPKSSIATLDPELRSELDRLLAEGRFTLRQVVAHMRELGVDVSKSAVHRHKQTLDKIAKDIRMARAVAGAVQRDLEETDGSISRALVESIQALVLRAQAEMGDDDEVDVKKVQALSMAVRDLETTLRLSQDRELKIRALVAKEAASAANKVAKERGLSASVADAIKASILGIGDTKRSP